jgi:hypothetical protein
MSTTNETQEEIVDLLVETATVRVWRVGTDYDIECQPGWTGEDFDEALAACALTGRTDYDLSYIPETGMEIFRMPVLSVPRPRGRGWIGKVVPAAALAPLTGLVFAVEMFTNLTRPLIGA